MNGKLGESINLKGANERQNEMLSQCKQIQLYASYIRVFKIQGQAPASLDYAPLHLSISIVLLPYMYICKCAQTRLMH